MVKEQALGRQVKAGIFSRNTIRLMRFPFSYFLMPVFLFALSQLSDMNLGRAAICFAVLHLFIYPASNGYNSYMDNDEGSIGGLKQPPAPTRGLFHLSILFDVAGLALSTWLGWQFLVCVLAYVIASHAYSYRGIRLKKLPVTGFFTVVLFQGPFTFWMVYNAINTGSMAISARSLAALAACTFLISGFYPLTQVYQHEEDSRHGDITISSVLGYTGTFVFSAVMFLSASAALYYYFYLLHEVGRFIAFTLFTLPVVIYFTWWFAAVIKDRYAASFENTMQMNLLGSTCLNLYFLALIVINNIP